MIAALVLGCAQAPAAHGPEPGPRAALAGIAGFQSVSRLDFGPQQNRLTAVYVFPDRVRWHFENYAAVQRSEHQYYYRHGERVHALASGGPSRALQGEERDAVLLQMELRRAAMTWPDGFAWEDAGAETRSAAVQADSCCRELALGRLVATLADGRPGRIEAHDAAGRVLEALEIREWREHAGRTWPRILALQSEQGGFVETIESIETRVHYLELSFLPPDLRPVRGVQGPGPSVTARDLVAMTFAVRALPVGLSWEEAIARAREWIDEAARALAPRALAVDPVPTFELSAEGKPVRCLVRLTAPVSPPPEGYQTLPERSGLFAPLQGLGEVGPATLERLLAATPELARAGAPYLRLHERPVLPVELVLPLEPAD